MDLNLEIITPDCVLYSADVGLIQLPGANGRFTVLKNHAPIVSALSDGQIRVIGKDGKESFFKCTGGIFECNKNRAFVLIDSVKQ